MPASFIDYAIAVGLLVVAFSAVVSTAVGFSASSMSAIQQSTHELQARSLLGLATRSQMFDTSISGIGLAKTIVNATAQPPEQKTVISQAARNFLASQSYSSMKEDFDFRIRLLDAGGAQVFSYGLTPQLGAIVLQTPVLYESGSETMPGIFIAEVWQ